MDDRPPSAWRSNSSTAGRIYSCVHCDAEGMALGEVIRHNETNHPETVTRRTMDPEAFAQAAADMRRSLGR